MLANVLGHSGRDSEEITVLSRYFTTETMAHTGYMDKKSACKKYLGF